MFSFIVDMRFQVRQQVLANIQAAAPGMFDSKFKSHSGFGSMALFGVSHSKHPMLTCADLYSLRCHSFGTAFAFSTFA